MGHVSDVDMGRSQFLSSSANDLVKGGMAGLLAMGLYKKRYGESAA